MLKIEDAKAELAQKSYKDIQVETAYKWAARAATSYDNVLTADADKKFALFLLAEEYYYESVEHAALADDVEVLKKVQEEVAPYAALAESELEKVFGI